MWQRNVQRGGSRFTDVSRVTFITFTGSADKDKSLEVLRRNILRGLPEVLIVYGWVDMWAAQDIWYPCKS